MAEIFEKQPEVGGHNEPLGKAGQSVSANGEETYWHYEGAGVKIVIQLVESATETTVEVRF